MLATTQRVSPERITERAAELLPEIRDRVQEIESGRCVPRDLVEKLRTAGCFRMTVPTALGGTGCSQLELFELHELLAEADASVAWIVMIGGAAPNYLAAFPESTIRNVYRDGPDVIMAAALAPSGTATPVPGGYRVKGRWSWASGSAHADWVMCNCFVQGGSAPQYRSVLLDPGEVTLIDTWHTSGLKGTGSGDVVVDDVFVAEAMTGALFNPPASILRRSFAAGAPSGAYVASVALGIAEGALQDLVSLAAGDKRRLGAAKRMADDEVFQNRLGEADATLRAARAALHAQMRTWEVQAACTAADPAALLANPLLAATNATSTWVTRMAASVVDVAYMSAAGSAVWEHANLQRRFRDVHAATQHIAVAESKYTQWGAARTRAA